MTQDDPQLGMKHVWFLLKRTKIFKNIFDPASLVYNQKNN